MSILMCIIGAVLITALISLFAFVCIKEPKVLIITLFVAIILGGMIIAPSIAEEPFVEVYGHITQVAPELFNGYPILVITVETFDGDVYLYYSEEEVDTQGVVTLLLWEDEVVDVY